MPAKDRPRRKAPDSDAAGQAPKQDEAAAIVQSNLSSTAGPSLEQDGRVRRSRRAAAAPAAEAPERLPAESKAAAAVVDAHANGNGEQAAAAGEEVTNATAQQKAAAKGKKTQQQSKPEVPTKPPGGTKPEHVSTRATRDRSHQQQQEPATGAQLLRTPHSVLLARGEQVGDLATLALQVRCSVCTVCREAHAMHRLCMPEHSVHARHSKQVFSHRNLPQVCKLQSPTQYSVPLVQITNKMSGASKEMFTAAMTHSPPLVRSALEQVSNCCSALQAWQAVP